MIRLQHSDVTQVQRNSPDKSRPFHTLGVTPFVSRVMLGSALAFGVGSVGSSLFLPRTAMAQEDTVTVGGMKAQKASLPNTITALLEQSSRYSQGESHFVLSNGKTAYGNMLLIPHTFKASIVLTSDIVSFGLQFTKGKGKEEGGFPGFKQAVEKATGKKWEKAVLFFVFEKDSETKEDMITAYALAADKDGNLLKYHGDYLGVGGSYYTQQGIAYIDGLVVSEPTTLSKR